MSKFNEKTKGNTRAVNKAGGRAFSMTPELELLHGTLTTFLDNKYYESSGERTDRLRELMSNVSPEYAARLAVVARREFNLRSVSHLILGELALTHSGDDLVKRSVVKSAVRPDDLTEFAAYIIAGSKNSKLTKQAKRGIRNALLNFDGYQLAKYRGEGKSMSLVDLFNLSHPRPEHATQEQKRAWKELMHGTLKNEKTWESRVSASKDEENKKKIWEEMVLEGTIGYMALLRNLNNLVKSGVSEEVINKAAEVLSDEERVKKSKQLPFRFYTAYKNVQGNRVLSDAISEALDISVTNAPVFEGKTLVAIDTSGSMRGNPLENAAVLGAALLKANKGADVVLFNDRLKEFEASGRTPVVDIVDRIMHADSGGTNTSLVFEHAESKGDKYDRVIILSDNESWQDSSFWSRRGTQEALIKYMDTTGADPYVFCIDIQGYGTKDISHPKAFHVSGFSDRVLDFVGKVEKSESLVEYVKNYEL